MTGLLVNVDVPDLEAAIRFYTEGLGLRLHRRLAPDIAELRGAAAPLFLIEHAPGSTPVAGAGDGRAYGRHWTPVHLDFVVPDLEAAVRRATACGAAAEGEVRVFTWGRYQVMADPFGHGFCLLSFVAEDYTED